jgi:hypothetical protein
MFVNFKVWLNTWDSMWCGQFQSHISCEVNDPVEYKGEIWNVKIIKDVYVF